MSFQEKLVKVLRTTYLGLLGTTLALLVASSVSNDLVLSEAVQQAREVGLLNAELHEDEFVRFAIQVEPQRARSLPEIVRGLAWEIDGTLHALEPPTSYTFADGRHVDRAQRIWIPVNEAAFPLSRPPLSLPADSTTLQDFQVAYDFLSAGSEAFLVDSLVLAEADVRIVLNGSVAGLPDDRLIPWPASADPIDPLRALHVEVTIQRISELGGTRHLLVLEITGGPKDDPHADTSPGRRIARAPVHIETHPVPLFAEVVNASLARELSYATEDWSFARSFPDLAQLAEGIETLDLESLRGYMERLRRERGTEVELYGVTIPRRVISLWGAFVLFGVQLFFFVHINRFQKVWETATDRDVVWIGLYNDAVAGGLVHSTFWLAPVVLLILLLQGWSDPAMFWTRWLVLFVCIAGFVVAFLTSIGLKKCRDRLHSESEPEKQGGAA